MRSFTVLGLALGLASLGCRGEGKASMLADEERPSASQAVEEEDDDGEDDGEEVEIPLSEVPANVREAAQEAVPGLALEKAEREREKGRLVYCLEGRADGERVEVEVSAEGEVLEIERADAEDDD
jgi:hypothetical protein